MKMPLSPPRSAEEQAYAAERRRVVLIRVRWATALALFPIGIITIVNLLVFPDRLGERLQTLGVQAALNVLVLLCSSRRWAERAAIAVAMVLIMGMGTTLFWSLSLSAGDLDVLVGPIIVTMVASTLIFPWGLGPQIAVSVYIAGGYFLVPPWPHLEPSRTANVLIGLCLGAATSMIGAFILDRQRRATFAEREQVSALAHQRELLVEAGRELNGTLELSALVDRIVHHASRLLGCAATSLALFDERRSVLCAVAAASDEPEPHRQMLGIEFPAEPAREFLEDLRRSGALELPAGGAHDWVQHFPRHYGFERTLYVAIQRDGRLLGFLTFSQRPGFPLTVQHRSLAAAIAHQVAIALANARLVEDLQTASRIKSEFVSTMSHELRTPLHVILGFVEMARDPSVPAAERDDSLGRIETAGRELLGLIESTLEIGRIEAGRDAVRLESVSLSSLWTELGQACARMPRRPDVSLEWKSDVPPISLLSDPRKLTVVVRNLVSNALKFTERGTVRAELEIARDGLVLRVADTGIGIRPEDQESIFEIFRQADGSDSRRYGGTGLGLYIVRRFVQQLGGEVSLDSAPGRGSVFTVRLPSAGADVSAAA
jgi:signal transduction histidine kinase